MTILDRLMPEPRLVELDGADLCASPEEAWARVRHGDLGRSPITRALFELRTLPARLSGEHPEPPATRIDDIDAIDGPGFHVLGEEPGREVALGAIGKVWRLDIPFVDVRDAERFADFAEPGYVRVAWAVRVLARGEGSRVEVEVRVDATDDESWRRFRRYFRIIGPGSHFIRRTLLASLARELGEVHEQGDTWRDVLAGIGGAAAMALDLLTPFLRRARSTWGVGEELAARAHPGDELVPEPRWSWTHGVEIDAPPERVWPWIAQLGADRGGFYSYQWLENLAGCALKNADAVHPEWALSEGDALILHPKTPGLRVARVEPGRFLLAHGAADQAARRAGEPWVEVTWLFHLEPLDGGRTRFVSRFRSACSDDLATRLAYGPYLTESIGFVMDRRMLLGVKERAERGDDDVLHAP